MASMTHQKIQLTDSTAKYRALFEQSKDAIVITDDAGMIVEVNQAGLDLFGYTSDELFGKDVARLYSDIASREQMIQQLLEQGFVRDVEVNLRCKDGTTRLGLVTIVIVREAQDTPPLYYATIRD